MLAVFLKKVGKMRHFFKTQCESDFRNVPLGLGQQYFCLLKNPATYDFACSFSRCFFQNSVEVIDVDAQYSCKICRSLEL